MDGGSKACISFIASGGDAPELLEPLESVLDEMSPFVHLGIMRDGRFAISLGGNDGGCAAFVQGGAQAVVVEGFVADERGEIDILDQWLGANGIMALTKGLPCGVLIPEEEPEGLLDALGCFLQHT
jgi:hypothetical protein